MRLQNYEVQVLANGVPLQEYFHDYKHYIEGKEGSEFSIRIKNNGWNRILAVPSVDGLSVMDGKSADHNSSGYIINGRDSLTIDGWRTSDRDVAKFFFTTSDNSYASRKNNGGNLGVIGVMIFREKEYPMWVHMPTLDSFDTTQSFAGDTITTGNSTSSVSMLYSSDSGNLMRAGSITKNFTSQEIGTGWGESKRSDVTTVDFEREDGFDSLFELFYNTRNQLRKIGVDFHRPVYVSPKSFPGGYCQPPK